MKGRLGYTCLVGGVAAIALAFASTAAASTVSGPFSIEVDADPGEANQMTIVRSGSTLVITDTAGVTDDSPDCSPVTPEQVTCAVKFLHVRLGDMNDQLTVTMPTRYGELTAAGGDGNDRIDFSAVGLDDGTNPNGLTFAVLRGDAGNDTMIGSQDANEFDYPCLGLTPCADHDLGDDTMIGGPGYDVMSGGRGSDFLDGRGGADGLRGTRFLPPESPFPTGLFEAEDNAVDTILCGDPSPKFGGDSVWAGAADQIGIDCEQIQQQVLCPPTGALCDGTPLVSTTTTAAAGSSAGTAKKKRKRKKKIVLGRAQEKLRVQSGKSATVLIELRGKRVRKALGRRNQMTVTFSQNFDRIKKGRKVGEANRLKRFKMRRGG